MPGDYFTWRMSNFQNTMNWAAKLDCHDGGGLHTIYQQNGTPFDHGIPNAETGRFGGAATGMYDRQDHLMWRAWSYSSWTPWTRMRCFQDYDLSHTKNWYGQQQYVDVYKSVKHAFYCPSANEPL